ncbi:hypothetical protein [Sorangium sp. So ce117]|uniref:hypothetical protein n=1 Tax=Sorangium sp. So ce117 TaxID=3133277 RepID=UPI003F604F52
MLVMRVVVRITRVGALRRRTRPDREIVERMAPLLGLDWSGVETFRDLRAGLKAAIAGRQRAPAAARPPANSA